MKIYTRTGDKGETGLFGGQRVGKDFVLIEACGIVDELNASLGVAVAQVDDQEIATVIIRIQNELFILGSDIATPDTSSTSTNTIPRVSGSMIARLENEIDKLTDEAGELTNFILPGGSVSGASIHLARCVCRRAERTVVHAMRSEPISADVLIYLNRLSDHLFQLARVVNKRSGQTESIWSRDTAKP